MGVGGIDPYEVQTIFGGVPGLSYEMAADMPGPLGRSERPSKSVVIRVFHVDYCLLGFHRSR